MNKVLSANIQYIAERYAYLLKFNLNNIGQYISYLSYDNNLIENPEYVYKYYGRTTNSLNSLKQSYLYFSDPRAFNDPFDCLVNRERYIIANNENMKRHRDSLGVCSFSIVNDNPLMWGHYANCFTGFCIKLKNDFANKQEIAVRSHVAYLENYSGINESLNDAVKAVDKMNLSKDEKNTIQVALKFAYLYCWKFADWKYEKEYRAISTNALDFKRQLHYKAELVQEIYIGYRMKLNYPNYFKNLKRIIKNTYPNAITYEVSPHPIKVKLEFERL